MNTKNSDIKVLINFVNSHLLIPEDVKNSIHRLEYAIEKELQDYSFPSIPSDTPKCKYCGDSGLGMDGSCKYCNWGKR